MYQFSLRILRVGTEYTLGLAPSLIGHLLYKSHPDAASPGVEDDDFVIGVTLCLSLQLHLSLLTTHLLKCLGSAYPCSQQVGDSVLILHNILSVS
jgi:hypothetical protein